MLGVEEGCGKPVLGVEEGCGKPVLGVEKGVVNQCLEWRRVW